MSYGRAAAICIVASLAVAPVSAEMVNRIVATVDGDPITAHEVRRYAEERRTHGVPDRELLEAVITDKILEKEIASRKIAAKSEDVDRYVDDVMARNKLTADEFKAALKQQGMTLEEYRARIKGEMEKTQLLGQELRTNVTVSDEEVAGYYEQHKEEFATRSGVVVRDIFFAFRQDMTQQDAMRLVEQAKAVKEMADNGQSFAELARRYSQGPGADKGGLLGSFKKGEMSPPLEQAAFALAPGEVSPPIVTPSGIHVLKVDGIQSDGRVELEQVRDQIRQMLTNQAIDQRFRDWIAKNLRERHHVEVID